MSEHKISLTTAVLLNINIMVGSGILIGPSRIAAIAGNASFFAWPIVALIFLPLVLCTVQLSKMFPGCGGFYSYAKEGLGTAFGFLTGLLYILGYIFCIAIDLLALRNTLIFSFGDNWLFSWPLLFNCVCLVLFFLFNLLSFGIFTRLLNSLTITKVLPLLIAILLLPLAINFQSFIMTSSEICALPLSLPLAIFGFLGFEACCSVSHLIENAEKNAPRAIIMGFLITALLYTLFHLSVLHMMGVDNLVRWGAPAFAQFARLPGGYLNSLISLLVPLASLCTIFAASNALLNANAMMLQAMASERIFKFWPVLLRNTTNDRPWVALILQLFMILSIITFMPSMDAIGTMCNLSVFLSFLLAFCSLLVLQHKNRLRNKMLLTIAAMITASGLVMYCWYVLADTVVGRIQYTTPLIFALVIGLLLYMSERRNKN